MNYLSIRLYVIHNHQLCCGLISCFLDFFQSFFSVYFSAGLVSDAVLQFTSLLGQLLFFSRLRQFCGSMSPLAYFSCAMQLFCSRSRSKSSFLSNAMVWPKKFSHINIEILGRYLTYLVF